MEDKKQSLNIGLSSMACWLYIDGDLSKEPIRAFADANCDVCVGEFKPIDGKYGYEEEGNNLILVEYDPKHIVKLRDEWDGFADEKYYGEIKTKPGNSPFI